MSIRTSTLGPTASRKEIREARRSDVVTLTSMESETPSMRVREMRLEDMDGVHEAWRESWRSAYVSIFGEEKVEEIVSDPSEERYRRHLEERDVNLVVVENGEVAGFADYVVYTSDHELPEYAFVGEAELTTLYVHPEYWRSGVATVLLEEGIERLPENVDTMKVKTLAENDIGRSFYESRGFDMIGEIQDEIGDETYPTVVYALSSLHDPS